VDRRLDKIGTPEATALRGQTAIANARLAYELYEQHFSSDRWTALAARGARPQKPLWASTSTKDASFRDTMYIEELVAPGTVNTMPEPTLHAVADHGQLRGDTIRGTYDQARKVLADMEALGISYDDVMRVLETEAVEKFAASWHEMLASIKGQLDLESGK
jgi:transaldolase